MADQVTLRRPSNGMIVFALQSLGLGLAMLLHPEMYRNHATWDFLDDANLAAIGGTVMALSLAQMVADAAHCMVARSIVSGALGGFYVLCALGNVLSDPAPSIVIYSAQAVFEALLALRKI